MARQFFEGMTFTQFMYHGKLRSGKIVLLCDTYLKLEDSNDGTVKTFSFAKMG